MLYPGKNFNNSNRNVEVSEIKKLIGLIVL